MEQQAAPAPRDRAELRQERQIRTEVMDEGETEAAERAEEEQETGTAERQPPPVLFLRGTRME